MNKEPMKISSEFVLLSVFTTWIFLTIILVSQAQLNTEHKMRIERLEDESMGKNMPVTHEVKPVLTEKSNG